MNNHLSRYTRVIDLSTTCPAVKYMYGDVYEVRFAAAYPMLSGFSTQAIQESDKLHRKTILAPAIRRQYVREFVNSQQFVKWSKDMSIQISPTPLTTAKKFSCHPISLLAIIRFSLCAELQVQHM